jgi:hypothetical protein
MREWITDKLEKGIEFYPPVADAFTGISITIEQSKEEEQEQSQPSSAATGPVAATPRMRG